MLLIITGTSAGLFAENEPVENVQPIVWEKHTIELSFGNALLFLDQGIITNESGTAEKRVLPVSSYLFLGEWRITNCLELAGAWNIPKDTVKRTSGGKVYEKYVAPSYGAGVAFIPFTFTILRKTHVEVQMGAFLFNTYNSTSSKGNFIFPSGTARLHISRPSGTGLYAGVFQAPAKKTTALIFGIGQRF